MSFSLLAFLPVSIFAVHEWTHWNRVSFDSEEKLAVASSKSMALLIGESIEAKFTALQTIAAMIKKPEHNAANQALLDLYREKFQFGAMYVIDATGFSVIASPGKTASGKSSLHIDYRDRDYFKSIFSGLPDFISPVQFGRITGKASLHIAVPIWNAEKTKVIGLVGSSITAQEMNAIVRKSVENIPDINFVLTDSNYKLITRSGNADPKSIEDYSRFQLLQAPSLSGVESVDWDNNKIYGASFAISIKNSAWHIAIYRPLSVVQSHVSSFESSAKFFSILTLALAVLFGAGLSALIAHPIIEIMNSIKGLAIGHAIPQSRADKNKIILHELHDTGMALAITAEKLQENTASLEQRVKEKTDELEAQRAKGIQGAKLAALGEMAAGIAHEINNPLAIISLKTQQLIAFIEAGNLEPEFLLHSLRKLDITATRIAKIVRGLRAISRSAENDPFDVIQLETIVDDTLSLCGERIASSGVDLQVNLDPEIYLNCRGTQLSQVLLNLLSNSLDAVQTLEKRWIHVRAEKLPSTTTRITVTDSGFGISASVVEKIMQPFFTTKAVGKGTGLGLSISMGIINEHGGQFYYDQSCTNTRFVIELPLAKHASKKRVA